MATQPHYSADSVEDNRESYRTEARPWLALITEGTEYFRRYQETCDNIDRKYASIEELAGKVADTDAEFKLFWANIEVLKPTVYSRPPVPVVVPQFKDRKPVPREAANVLERSLITLFDREDIHETLYCVRDDMLRNGRGVPWLRYSAKKSDGGIDESVPWDHVDRKDFLHAPARKWKEVNWVARRSFLTRDKMKNRFKESSGDLYLKATYERRKIGVADDANAIGEQKAQVWEIWHKDEGCVVWVSPELDEVLDYYKTPHLTLDKFFPCPKPAFGTVQPGTLIPVPDVIQYEKQVDDICDLTQRISALQKALRARGFYSSGAKDLSDAIETALELTDDSQMLVPVANAAMMGSGKFGDSLWMWPIDVVAATIRECVDLRRILIDDVYQLTGLSDIMRGETDARETKGAQVIKAQYGQIRLRDKQGEMVRVAKDCTRICAEIMAENFQEDTLLEMSQVDDLPTEADMQQQAMMVEQKLQQVLPQVQDPQQAQQVQKGAQKKLEDLSREATREKVFALLRGQRARPFVLDIETDSTIQPDEDADKARRIEYLTAVGGFVKEGILAVQMEPRLAKVMASHLKFIASGFRVGRELEDDIDSFAEQLEESPPQPKQEEGEKGKGGDPQVAAMQAMKGQLDLQREQLKTEQLAQKHQGEMAKLQADMQQAAAKLREMEMKMEIAVQDRQRAQLELMGKAQESDAKKVEAAISDQYKRDELQARTEAQRAAAASKANGAQSDG